MYYLCSTYVLSVTAQEGPVIAYPGQDVELLCTVTPSDGEVAAWENDQYSNFTMAY